MSSVLEFNGKLGIAGHIIIYFHDIVPGSVGHLNSRLECSPTIMGLWKGTRLKKIDQEKKVYFLEYHHKNLINLAQDIEFIKQYIEKRNGMISSITLTMEG